MSGMFEVSIFLSGAAPMSVGLLCVERHAWHAGMFEKPGLSFGVSSGVHHHLSMQTEAFMSSVKLAATFSILLLATACGDTWGQRAVTGGAIGAGAGAGIGAVSGIGVLPGALVGGAVGAGVGAATTPER